LTGTRDAEIPFPSGAGDVSQPRASKRIGWATVFMLSPPSSWPDDAPRYGPASIILWCRPWWPGRGCVRTGRDLSVIYVR